MNKTLKLILNVIIIQSLEHNWQMWSFDTKPGGMYWKIALEWTNIGLVSGYYEY